MAAHDVIARPLELPQRDTLGEGPVWDVAEQALYWVDIVERGVFRFDPASGAVRRWTAPSMVSLATRTTRGDLLLALEHGAWRFDEAAAAATPLGAPDPEPDNRSNDCKVDPSGALLLGTMFNTTGPDKKSRPLRARGGGLFRINGDGGTTRLLGGIGIPNAIAFTPDGERMTFADTTRDVIWSFAYDPDGPLEDRRVLMEGGPGHPDGAAMDADGCLWSARWGAGAVLRITPDGRIDRTLELPVQQPSCCAFGGPDLKTLYVTSARQDLPGLDDTALDGALFAVSVDVAGVPTPRFAG